MKLKLNTNLVPFFSGTYGTIWEDAVQEIDDDGNELEVDYDFKDFMKSIAHVYTNNADTILRDLEVSFIKSINFTGDFSSPREYNFSTDTLDFEVEIDEAELYKTLDKLSGNSDFEKWLSDNFSSYDGFISFTPNNFKDLRQAIVDWNDEHTQAISAVIRYLAGQETLDSIEENVFDDYRSNGYGGLDYEVVDENENNCLHNFDDDQDPKGICKNCGTVKGQLSLI